MILLDKRALYSGLVHEQMTASRHTLQSRWYSSLYTPVSVNSHILLYNYKLYAPTLPNEIISPALPRSFSGSSLICSHLAVHSCHLLLHTICMHLHSTLHAHARPYVCTACVCIVYMHACMCACTYVLYFICKLLLMIAA